MKLLDMFSIGNESIDFQKNNFGKELENVFAAIAEIPFRESDEIVTKFAIFDAIIFKYTGLKTKFQHVTDTVGATSVLQININNVLLEQELKHWFTDTQAHAIDILKKADEIKKKHTVNLKTCKVTGIFSHFESPVYININFFKNWKITPGQMTAILLHEIGHIFTYCEFISRQVTTNQILSAVSKSIIDKDSAQQREFIFKSAFDILDTKPDNIEKLANQNDIRIAAAVCIKASVDKMYSELGVSTYDSTSCEMLADQFVSRHGYGREAIEVFDIIGKIFKDYEKSKTARNFVNISQAFRIVFTVTGSVMLAIVGVPVLSLIFVLMTSVLIGFTGGEVNKDHHYDTLKVRFLRIREDTVNYLKNKDLDPSYVKKALADLEAMNKIIKDTEEARFLFDIIVDYVNPKSKKIRNSIELQRDLEALAMNDFFVKSAHLSTI